MQQASGTDYRKLDDPQFLAERARVRRQLERTPEDSIDRIRLGALYARMTAEFEQRASAAWAECPADRA